MKAFEDATGKALDETKKEIASEELIITGSLGEDIGADKATAIVNDIKTEIIKNNTSDTTQIAETINNVVNNYNITINASQQQQLEELMKKISEQDYNYNEMKKTLNGIKNTIEEKLEAIGEGIDRGFFENIFKTIKDWFTGFGEWFNGLFSNKEEDSGILGSTNDALLGENAIIDATDESTINLPSSEEVQGFFSKIWNWFTGLFNSDNSNKVEDNNTTPSSKEESNSGSTEDSSVDSLEQNSTVDENVQPDSSVENEPQDNENTNDSSNFDNLNTLDSNSSNEETIN